ncbi:MAG: hypothetical protein B7W98_02795 [Parcubacteria group bacterium 20-58-5]|nr:MAG: hypothetical protein B7W98_02795 [Parcubacteria group bacterium 20-58-5]
MEIHNVDASARKYEKQGEFVEAGWNQEPLTLLREIWIIASGWEGKEKAEKIQQRGAIWSCRDDMSSGSIGVLQVPEIDGINAQGYIVATWYKSRGTTDKPLVMFDGEQPQPLSVSDCYKIAAYYLENPELLTPSLSVEETKK